MNRVRLGPTIIVLAACCAFGGAVKGAEVIKEDLFKTDLGGLTRHPHRLAGFGSQLQTVGDVPGSYSASKYIEKRLRKIGFAESDPDAALFVQTFGVVQYETTACELIIDGVSYQRQDGFYACRPNIFQGSVTPAEGLTGQVVYAKAGQMSQYTAEPVKGKIVFLDYDCDKNWLDAFALGAAAVVFIEQAYDPNGPPVNPYHHINIPANLPRFYVTQQLAETLDIRNYSGPVTIKAACKWTEKRGRNVVAILRGTAPRFTQDRPEQVIVLAAPIDSLSEVPELSRGARDAANCAGLLQIAEYLMHNRPRRDIAICFLDAQTRNHFGARAFYGALMRNWKTIGPETLEDLRGMLLEEREFYKDIRKVVSTPDLFCDEARSVPYHQEAMLLLRSEVRNFDGTVLDDLHLLRLKRTAIQGRRKRAVAKRDAEQESESPDPAELAQLEDQIKDLSEQIEGIDRLIGGPNEGGLAKEEMDWNRVERHIHERKTLDQIESEIEAVKTTKARAAKRKEWEGVYKNLVRLAEHMRDLSRRRLDQITQELEEIETGMRLREALGFSNRYIALHISFNLGDARKRWTFIHGDDSAITLDQDKSGNYTSIYSTMQKVHAQLNGVLLLTAQDVQDFAALCKAILKDSTKGPTNIGARVWSALDERVQQIIQRAAANPADLRESDKSRIIKAISTILKRRDFWRGEDFTWMQISSQDRGLLALERDKLSQEEVQRLNRLVLESAYSKLLTRSPPVRTSPHFDPRPLSGLYEMHHFSPRRFVDSGAIARIFSVFNVSVMTALDRQGRQGHPFDTVEQLDVDVMLAQLRQVAPFIKALADHEGLNVTNSIRPDAKYHDATWSKGRAKGGSVMRAGGGSAMADRPVADALVAVLPCADGTSGVWRDMSIEKVAPGFAAPLIVKTGMNGTFGVPPAPLTRHKSTNFFAACFDKGRTVTDPVTGREQFMPSRGMIDSVINIETHPAKREVAADFTRASIHLFKTKGKTIVGYGYDRAAIKSIAMRALSTAKFRIDRHLICEIDSIVSLYGAYDAKGFKLFNKAGAVLLNNDKKHYVGIGVSMIDQWEHPVTSAVTAHDLQVLNEGRLDMLRDNRINQESLEILNSTARDLREDAQRQVTADAMHGFLAASAAMARRAYIPLVNVIKDLVTAVVLLLLLAMPFAYSLERLLIGTPHIYRQIGWFAVFFVATFIVLYFVNPAFSLAATPIVIFLAFGIIVLSSLVIFIMTRKLQAEIKKMQGLAATVHSADVSRLSTMMAAVHMGISTMRRRPLRTLLTASTVVLLTFTILTFASFGTSWGTRITYEETLTGPARILARHQLWNPIGEGVFNGLRGYLTKEAQVVPRYWISPTATNVKEAEKTDVNFERLVTSANGDYIAPVAAAIGLDRRDIDRQSEIKGLLAGQIDLLEADGIFLTDAVREELHLTVDDIGVAKVLLLGYPFTYAGVVTDRLAGFIMLEGSSMLPVDYRSSGGGSVESFTQDEAMATETLSEMPDIESAQFVTYNLHMNVIIGPRMAKLLGGQIRSITIYPNNIEDIQDLAQRVARVSELPTYVGDAGGVYRLIFTSLATASGWRDLLIPITLGGLIIFATMLGSISDREREIYTFSSLGLAPPHVASLFFAEASVYAFIGGMGGYLLGQVVARVMGWFAGMGWVSVPAMNYSSTNAIVTILIVMCTVMISTIYPAAKASRSANPGIQRSWQIPKPAGDLYDLIFPFTVSTYDITGVVSFLREHFDNYTDTSLGVFATIKGHIFRQRDNDMLGFTASVALAPFDLGVTQNFALLSKPSEIEGIDEIRILLHRLSGARGDWQRSNRVFINELRKQLLIWRSLSPQVMDRYRQQTLEKWDALPREQIDPQAVGETM